MTSSAPKTLASEYLAACRSDIAELPSTPKVLGLIASQDAPSLAYARATRQRFLDAGMAYDLQQVSRLDLEQVILAANEDSTIHGIFIYFPIFGNQQDDYLRNLVDYTKDVEAGSQYWTRKLYANDRFAIPGDTHKKALLPCTPLAIVKLLTHLGVYEESIAAGVRPLTGKTVSIFNRSEVIGRPLAVMMSNEGATVYSFDEFGPLCFENAQPNETRITRQRALTDSDIVITGVPSAAFPSITPEEVSSAAVCLNFSSFDNFAPEIDDHVGTYIARIGPMTVAMCLRNAIRLYQNFHLEDVRL
jgi:methylenetetrahydrofolate dehydrogenase (NADP+)/methenyltetrahydrofolate cyclohydrolase